MKLGTLTVEIDGDSSKLNASLTNAQASIQRFSKRARAAVNAIGKFGAAATAAGAALSIHLVNGAREAIDAQAKMAQQLDTTSASMATLTRAGELSGVSMREMQTAARTLSVRIGEAQQGVASAKDAFDRLGISAQSLQSIPLDQRIQVINQALEQNVDASERAAVAADLFGTRAATSMQMLQPDVLAQARKEAELFGLALSDVDAAKVEQANDALSTISKAFDGIVQQFTVQLAPVLKGVGQGFLDAAEDAGGFGNMVDKAFRHAVDAAGFVMNAADGVKRSFSIAADGIIIAFESVKAGVSQALLEVLELMDMVPGVDFSETIESVRAFRDSSVGIVREARDNIEQTLAAPLAGEAFKQFVADAQVAGQAAAEAAVQARDAVMGGTTEGDVQGGGDSDLEAKLEKLRKANMSELELLREKHMQELEVIKEGLAAKQLTEEEAQALSEGSWSRYHENKLKMEEQAAKAQERIDAQTARNRKAALSGMFSDLSSLMQSENRKQFEIGKAAAIASAGVETISSASKAFNALVGIPFAGPALATGAAASAIAAGSARISAIKSQQFGGAGSVSTAGAGGGFGGSATTAGGAQGGLPAGGQEVSRNVNISLQGDNFSQEQVRGLIDSIIEAQGDGAARFQLT